MSDFIHGPQLSHPPDGSGGLLSQDKPHNHGMNDPVSAAGPVFGAASFPCAITPLNYFYGTRKHFGQGLRVYIFGTRNMPEKL